MVKDCKHSIHNQHRYPAESHPELVHGFVSSPLHHHRIIIIITNHHHCQRRREHHPLRMSRS